MLSDDGAGAMKYRPSQTLGANPAAFVGGITPERQKPSQMRFGSTNYEGG